MTSPQRQLPPAVLEALIGHDWPGNVRALRHAAERAVIMADGERYRIEDFPLPSAAERRRGAGRRRDAQPRPARKADDRARAAHAPFQHLARRRRARAQPRRALPAHGETWTLGASSSSGLRGARSCSSRAVWLFVEALDDARPARRPDRRRADRRRRARRACGISSAAPISRSRASSNRCASRIIRSASPTRAAAASTCSARRSTQALKTLQARHMQESARGALPVGDRRRCPSALLAIDQDGRVELLNKAARQLFARRPLNRDCATSTRSARSSRRRSRLPRGNAQDHPADARRRSAQGDLRLGPGGAARPAGDGAVDPAGAERARRAGGRGAGRPRAGADPRDHELADAGDLARAVGRRHGRGRGERRTPTLADAQAARPRPSPAGPKASSASSKAIASSPRRRKSTAARSRRSPGPRRSCASRWPAPATARSTRGVEVEPKTLELNADPELLAQAVLNLLRNAIRATADVRRADGRAWRRRAKRSGQCRIEVRDNGPGIPEDRRDDIFLPFYTTHKGGSGVGLSFARQVALAHGGSISALDAPEGGANIRMVIWSLAPCIRSPRGSVSPDGSASTLREGGKDHAG